MKILELSNGANVPCLGQGTWYLGENKRKRNHEIEAIQTGIENGMYLIDTAEMYGDGKAEILIGEAISKYNRSNLFIVSKVYPWNAGRDNIFKSCENSLKRMNIEYMDMYLLHWRGKIPLSETVECMEELKQQGKIKAWGVSNFDTSDMYDLLKIKASENCCVNQVLYHLGSRGIEYSLLPFLKKNRIKVMAYCPLAQAGKLKNELVSNKAVISIAEKYNITPYQVLLTFTIQDENIIAIPRTSNAEHAIKNRQSAEIRLDNKDIKILNNEFPAPAYKTYLDIV